MLLLDGILLLLLLLLDRSTSQELRSTTPPTPTSSLQTTRAHAHVSRVRPIVYLPPPTTNVQGTGLLPRTCQRLEFRFSLAGLSSIWHLLPSFPLSSFPLRYLGKGPFCLPSYSFPPSLHPISSTSLSLTLSTKPGRVRLHTSRPLLARAERRRNKEQGTARTTHTRTHDRIHHRLTDRRTTQRGLVFERKAGPPHHHPVSGVYRV